MSTPPQIESSVVLRENDLTIDFIIGDYKIGETKLTDQQKIEAFDLALAQLEKEIKCENCQKTIQGTYWKYPIDKIDFDYIYAYGCELCKNLEEYHTWTKSAEYVHGKIIKAYDRCQRIY